MKGYDRFGVMLDCSRNGVLSVDAVIKFGDVISKVGYDTIMLYTEDTYEVDGEPYFGYMRGGYTADEIRKMDGELKARGVELIPCIQTLAHFTNLCKLSHYDDVIDVDDILLIDEPKTYALIDKMFATIASCFSSRTINIGMDEAHMVGLGKYLDKHGFQNRTELLLRHLGKVCEIAEKYGFKPLMWSDMFFRLMNHGIYCSRDARLSDEVKALLPESISLAYWDYYHKDKADYDAMFDAHVDTGKDVWFFGGAWTWTGFAPLNDYSLLTMLPAIESAKEHRIKNVYMTMWGDNGNECSIYGVLPALVRIAKAAIGENEAAAKEAFKLVSDIAYDDFIKLDLPNKRKADQPCVRNENLAKCLFYADPFMGYFDSSVEKIVIDFDGYAKELEKFSSDERYGYVFRAMSDICSFLAVKYDLGVRTRRAYSSNDADELVKLAEKVYPEAVKRLERFFESFRTLWFTERKPFGFEVQEARIGGLILRLKSCAERIAGYVTGKILSIEELEKDILPMNDEDFMYMTVYERLVSFGKIG